MNVFEHSQKILGIIFKDFDNIYISFSGGKDSGVLLNLCIDYMRRNDIKKRISVVHFNYEAEYRLTRDYVDRTMSANRDIVDYYNVCVPFKVNTCTSMFQKYWRPWALDKKELWVNDMPDDSYTVDYFDYYTESMWDYEFQEKFSSWHHEKNKAQKTCVLIGLRKLKSHCIDGVLFIRKEITRITRS